MISQNGGNDITLWSGYTSCNNRFRAVDNAGNVSSWSSAVHIHQDTEAPAFVNWWYGTTNTDIIQIYVQATDNIGISKIQLPTSTEKGGGTDWIWIDAIWDSSANAYRADIYPSSWGHYGTTYYTHLYIYDNAGNGGYYTQTSTYIAEKNIDIAKCSYSTGYDYNYWSEDPKINVWTDIDTNYVTNSGGTLVFQKACTISIDYSFSIYSTDPGYAITVVGLWANGSWVYGPLYERNISTHTTGGTRTSKIYMPAGSALFVWFRCDHGNQDYTQPNKVSTSVSIKVVN